MKLSDFDYELPKELIAQTPLEKRDEARLMVLHRSDKTIEHKVFKDILELKDMVKAYAKYLGLDDEKLLGELDDFLFEKTSKISIEDIKERLKQEQEKKKNEKKVRTPYTIEFENKKSLTLVIILTIVVVILVVFYILLKKIYL